VRKIAIEEHISRPQYMALRYTTPRGKARPFPLNPKEVEKLGPYICDEGVTRLEVMDRYEVSKCLLMSGSIGFDYIDDAEEAKKQTSEFNNFLLDCVVAKFPERYQAFVSLPFVNGGQAAEELRRCMMKPGCVGAVIPGSPRPGKFIDEPEYEVFWKAAEETGAYLYIHPMETPLDAMALYRNLDCLNGSTWSWGVDTATFVLRMIFSGLFDRHPNARVIMGHMGEMIPFVLQRIDTRWSISPMDSKNQKKPSEYMKKNVWITTSGNASVPALKCSIEALGADRIMFAVDYPFESFEEFSEFIDQADISEDDRRKICWENAESLFG
jgi:2,3-dihydroxybenzoate decarboxylase